jgi:hypothetical protein
MIFAARLLSKLAEIARAIAMLTAGTTTAVVMPLSLPGRMANNGGQRR